ncbi:MAG: hypothetical protein MJ252_14305 [archaeon]|nr:hypothetical protein [archaeon]
MNKKGQKKKRNTKDKDTQEDLGDLSTSKKKDKKKEQILRSMYVCSSGFEDNETNQIQEIVNSLGGTYDNNLKASTNYLITNKASTIKAIVKYFLNFL